MDSPDQRLVNLVADNGLKAMVGTPREELKPTNEDSRCGREVLEGRDVPRCCTAMPGSKLEIMPLLMHCVGYNRATCSNLQGSRRFGRSLVPFGCPQRKGRCPLQELAFRLALPAHTTECSDLP